MLFSKENIIKVILGLYLIFCGGLLYWTVIYSGSGDGDTLEHVHTSWLVWSGKLPYKDFFQHHNPLLWYVGAPLVGFYEYSLRAVDAVNMLTVTVFLLMLWYIYRLHKDFLSNKIGGLVAAAFCALPQESLYNKDFKPDNFMATAIIAGIYYLFCYMRDKRVLPLFISFMLFFASFMFTQKAALIVIGIGVIILWLIREKKIKLEDCIISGSIPFLIFLAFLAFLYYEDVLTMYIKANFELNAHIPDVFYTRRYIHPSLEMTVPILFAIYALVKNVYDGNVYIKTFAIIFILEYLIRMYYFTPFVYYFALLHALASTLAGVAVAEIIKKKQWFSYIVLSYFIVLGGIYANIYRHRITVGDDFKYGASGFVLRLTTPCDYVVNGYRIGYNLFNKDIDFIWNLKGQIDVIAATIGIRPTSDLESLIRKCRPKIIYGKNYYDTYREYRGEIGVHPIHWISSHLLEEMYIPLNRDDLYILKPEYQSYDCRYNVRTKSYEYVDKH